MQRPLNIAAARGENFAPTPMSSSSLSPARTIREGPASKSRSDNAHNPAPTPIPTAKELLIREPPLPVAVVRLIGVKLDADNLWAIHGKSHNSPESYPL